MVDVGDGTCFVVCEDGSTDPDETTGETDGYGYESEETCVVPGGVADTGVPCAE
jgi:hypothetical protein